MGLAARRSTTVAGALALVATVALGLAPTAGAKTLGRAGWNPQVRQELIRLVEGHRGRGEVALFDFDNTTQARDIGNATLAQLIVNGDISPATVSPALAPPFTTGGQRVSVADNGVWDYYNLFGNVVPQRGLSVYDALYVLLTDGVNIGRSNAATRQAYANGAGRADVGRLRSVASSILPGAQRPFVYPQMADLYGYLRDRGYDVWIVSASEVWTVRWMALNELNPVIRARWGARNQLPISHVIGVSTLMERESDGRFLVDDDLRGNPRYLRGDPAILNDLRIHGANIREPGSSYYGKPANVLERIGTEKPFLVAGDSQGDFGNFRRARHRLWITRLQSPSIQADFPAQVRLSRAKSTWLLQPTLVTDSPGFVPCARDLAARTRGYTSAQRLSVRQSLATLRGAGLLESWQCRAAVTGSR